MKRKSIVAVPIVASMLAIGSLSACHSGADSGSSAGQANAAPAADLKLPSGFSATVIADSLGALRHLAVTKEGNIYVKLAALNDGTGGFYLTDPDKDGVYDQKTAFADYPGTGIAIKDGYLYSSSNTGVFRYKLNGQDEIENGAKPEELVKGLVAKDRDNSKSIALDDKGNLYVTIGSYSDACREKDSGKGMKGCPLLDSVGGVWEFKADKTGQSYGDGKRYATGLKNVVGMAWNDNTNSLFGLQHGRGQFDDKFPQYYTAEQSSLLPAETMYELKDGSDAGWPYVYYDHFKKKKMLAPEYGGDGKKTGGEKALDPVVAFPAHLGPNALLFYTGDMFPEKYKNGAFIAFHSQSPELHNGYFVAFVPFKDGKPSGKWEIFAENFAGVDLSTGKAAIKHRPDGLAQGPDGALYVTDDLGGAIFKIVYKG